MEACTCTWPQSTWRGADSICTEKIQQNVDSGCIIKVKSSFTDFSIFSIRICVYFVSGKSYFQQIYSAVVSLQNKEADRNVMNKPRSDRTQVWIWVGTLPFTNPVNFSKLGVFVYKLKNEKYLLQWVVLRIIWDNVTENALQGCKGIK